MAHVNEGDWVEGEPKWWWKYVFPQKAQFWVDIAMKQNPEPIPWYWAVAGEVQEGLAMLRAAAMVSADKETSERLKKEGAAKIGKAVSSLQHATSHA